MAGKRKTQVKKIRFELTRGAVGGIGVVVFCLFLWMFLLGVWAGQSLLLPTEGSTRVVEKKAMQQADPLVIRADKKVIKK